MAAAFSPRILSRSSFCFLAATYQALHCRRWHDAFFSPPTFLRLRHATSSRRANFRRPMLFLHGIITPIGHRLRRFHDQLRLRTISPGRATLACSRRHYFSAARFSLRSACRGRLLFDGRFELRAVLSRRMIFIIGRVSRIALRPSLDCQPAASAMLAFATPRGLLAAACHTLLTP